MNRVRLRVHDPVVEVVAAMLYYTNNTRENAERLFARHVARTAVAEGFRRRARRIINALDAARSERAS